MMEACASSSSAPGGRRGTARGRGPAQLAELMRSTRSATAAPQRHRRGPEINHWHEVAMADGALGGRLIGAAAGLPDVLRRRKQLRRVVAGLRLPQLRPLRLEARSSSDQGPRSRSSREDGRRPVSESINMARHRRWMPGSVLRHSSAVVARAPKALVEVAGRPFIARQLADSSARLRRRLVLCLGYLQERSRPTLATRSPTAWRYRLLLQQRALPGRRSARCGEPRRGSRMCSGGAQGRPRPNYRRFWPTSNSGARYSVTVTILRTRSSISDTVPGIATFSRFDKRARPGHGPHRLQRRPLQRQRWTESLKIGPSWRTCTRPW